MNTYENTRSGNNFYYNNITDFYRTGSIYTKSNTNDKYTNIIW